MLLKKSFLIISYTLYFYCVKGQSNLPCLEQSRFVSNWQFMGPYNRAEEIKNQHFGAVTAISVNPANANEIFIGASSGGLFHTTTRGKRWTCITDNFMYPVIGVNDIYVNYDKSPYTIMIATGAKTPCDGAEFGILKSVDGGQTWSMKYREDSTLFVSAIVKKIKKDKVNNVYYAIGQQSVIRSVDEGETWESIFSLQQVPSIIPTRDYEILSFELNSVGNELYFTTQAPYVEGKEAGKPVMQCDLIKISNCNAGKHDMKYGILTTQLTTLYSPAKTKNTFALKITKADTENLLIDRTYVGSYEHSIYTYNMQTGRFVNVISPNKNSLPEDILWCAGLVANTSSKKHMYLAGNILYRSVDSGHTFKALYPYGFGANNVPHADIRSIAVTAFSANGENDTIYLGTDGGLSCSDNSGKTFQNLNGESLPVTQFYGMGVSPFTGTISAGSQDNSIMSFIPAQNKWIIAIAGDGYDVEYNKRIPNVAYGQYNSRTMMMTTNDMAPFSVGLNIPPKERASTKRTLATDRNGNVFFAEDNFNILRKNASQWEMTEFDQKHETLAFAVSESDTHVIYLSKFWHSLFKSTDGGRSFQDISAKVKIGDDIKSKTRIHAICIAPDDASKVWISMGYLGDYRDPCRSGNRILYSSDGGDNWIDYSEGLPAYNVSDLVFLEGTREALFAATITGIFFRENSSDTWKLFSTGLPKCVVPEMQISYYTGKLIAATYGRGLWQTELPAVKFNAPLILQGKTIWEVPPDEALYFTQDIQLQKNATLIINSPVHMAKGKTIWVKNLNQISYGKNGKLLYDCGGEHSGVQVRK